jgi:hypothetical protein
MTNNTLPESFIVQQLLETLERIEQEAAKALNITEEMTQSDPERGYVRASGYSKGMFHSILVTARVYREAYNNA